MLTSRPFQFLLLLTVVLLLLRVAESFLFPNEQLSAGWFLIIVGSMVLAWLAGLKARSDACSLVELQKQQLTVLKGRLDRMETDLGQREKAISIMEEKLSHTLAEKEQLRGELHSQNQFLAQIAQEMRQPLREMLQSVRTMQKDPTPEQLHEMGQQIELSASHIASFINEMLEYCSVEAGKVVFDERPFRIRPLLEQVSQHWEPIFRDKNIDFRIEIHPRVPVSILGESINLRQILNNLLQWATQQKAVAGVHLNVAPQDLFLRNASLKFTLLVGAHNPMQNDPTTSGKGLPADQLMAVRRLVRLQQGRLDLRSESDGQATLVQIWLPFKLDTRLHLPVKTSGKVSENFLRGMSILIAEDNKVTQTVVMKILKDHGAEVSIASNGQEAVDVFEKQHFDAVIMDIHMPVMDGYEAVARIRQREGENRHVPILALTSSMMLTSKEKALMYGMDEYVGKPFSIDDLLDKLFFLLVESDQSTKTTLVK